jgi:hypothetical protein
MDTQQSQTVFIPNALIISLFKIVLFVGCISCISLVLGLLVLIAQLIIKAYAVLAMLGHGLYALYLSRDGFEQMLILAIVLFATYLLIPRITRIVDRCMPYLASLMLASFMQTEQA